jgi:hypothetical protein
MRRGGDVAFIGGVLAYGDCNGQPSASGQLSG